MIRFPFAGIVGQERLKVAYLASIVNPQIGGLLISGPKGTGKSSIVYSAETILPRYTAHQQCLFRCDPHQLEKSCNFCQDGSEHTLVEYQMKIVPLPLSCTEDRLIGTINVEKLLKDGVKEVQPGILGEANRNILYIDEVNLLADHLVDDILDAAASHWNTIEREGISISHPASFVLIGTMNPEEGDLRPQILDRFPLCIKIDTISDPKQRADIIKRNLAFENDPAAFVHEFSDQSKLIQKQILDARLILRDVQISDSMIFAVASSCQELKCDGQRPDIVIVKTAKTIAALNGRKSVVASDTMVAAHMVLIHRTRDGGLLEPPSEDEIYKVLSKNLSSLSDDTKQHDESSPDAQNQIVKKKTLS